MKTVTLSEFRRKCSALLKLANEAHETIQITRFGRPVADIRPPGPSAEQRAARQARDIELLNKYADEMKAEAEESMFYDVPAGYVLRKIRVRKKKGRKRKRVRSGVTLKP